ncbi:hypothetical protein M758_10G078600 [Ceratodon purpureus]|nr:hypothetical protein M758_10G078600 [Ceratodon purpureus]
MANRQLELLIFTLKTGRVHNLSMVLSALVEIEHKSVLRGIIKLHGVQVFSYMLNAHKCSFETIPILRSTLHVLQHSEWHGVFRDVDLTCSGPEVCTVLFSQPVFDLTMYSNSQICTLASTFHNLNLDSPEVTPTTICAKKHGLG